MAPAGKIAEFLADILQNARSSAEIAEFLADTLQNARFSAEIAEFQPDFLQFLESEYLQFVLAVEQEIEDAGNHPGYCDENDEQEDGRRGYPGQYRNP